MHQRTLKSLAVREIIANASQPSDGTIVHAPQTIPYTFILTAFFPIIKGLLGVRFQYFIIAKAAAYVWSLICWDQLSVVCELLIIILITFKIWHFHLEGGKRGGLISLCYTNRLSEFDQNYETATIDYELLKFSTGFILMLLRF